MSVYGNGGGDYGGSMPAGTAYSPAPMQQKVRFEIIGEAWELFRQQMGTWVLAVLLVFVIEFGVSFVISFVGAFAGISMSGGRRSETSPTSIVFSLFNSLVTNVLTWYLMGGLYKMALKQLRSQPISVGDVFSAGDMIVPLFLCGLLYGLSVLGGALLLIIPAFIVAGLLMLAPVLIADKRVTSPVEAIKASWNALKTDMLSATLFNLVLGIISGLGVIACGIGMFFTYPLFFIGHAILYRDFFGLGTEQPYESGNVGPQNPWASR